MNEETERLNEIQVANTWYAVKMEFKPGILEYELLTLYSVLYIKYCF